MKSWIASLAILFFAAMPFALVQPATAEDVLNPVCTNNPTADVCRDNNEQQTPTNNSIYGPNGILTKATQLLTYIIGVASVIVIIIAGLQYILAAGDASKISAAKNMILYALIGVVIALLAQSIIIFVIGRL